MSAVANGQHHTDDISFAQLDRLPIRTNVTWYKQWLMRERSLRHSAAAPQIDRRSTQEPVSRQTVAAAYRNGDRGGATAIATTTIPVDNRCSEQR